MKIKSLYLLLLGSIVTVVMLGSCKKKENKEEDPYAKDSGVFKDARDNKTYKWVKIGGQIWMAENLAYTGSGRQVTSPSDWKNSSSLDAWCYYTGDTNGELYGCYYQWELAKIAPPHGWHLPTYAEWQALIQTVTNDGHSGEEGTVLKSTTGWASNNGTDLYGFKVLPSGGRYYSDGHFNDATYVTQFWTSTVDGPGRAKFIGFGGATVSSGSASTGNGYSIRCVKD